VFPVKLFPAVRTLAAAAAIGLLVPNPAVPAQDAGQAWESLVNQALDAAHSGDYPKAEKIFLQALREAESFGADDVRIGTTVNTLGLVYLSEKKFSEAEVAFRRALTILGKAYGSDSIDVANVNFNIANVMFSQGHQSAAMPFLRKVLPVYENILGGASMKTAAVLCMMGDSYRLTKDLKNAEDTLRRCADVRESGGGLENAELADALGSLALTYEGEGKYAAADARFTLAEKIRENTLGITSPVLAQTMEDHAALLRLMGREKDAALLETMAAAILGNTGRGK
jgi:tetratricopeptide (TPR) repeat protein